ncbi:hypothetical protein GGF43_002880 [Coemansia sp. RSA 2618]|nr:hypothetical protein GGF43_002880 [Coemansia sp. RSA 2618]
MYRQGFGRRTFTLEEECLLDTMGRDGKQRLTAKVHIIRSESTVAEIQDKHNMLQYHASIGDRSLHKRLAQLQFVEKAVKESKQFSRN